MGYEVEEFFRRFPDVPREVIVKEDVMRQGTRFTEAALEAAKGYQRKTYYLFSYDRVKVGDMKNREALRAPEEFCISGGIYDLRRTIMPSRISNNSPYEIDLLDGRLKLLWKGLDVAEVEYKPEPKYYSRSLEDGTPFSEICASVNWGQMMFCTVLRSCQYWGDKEECKFCDINTNARQQKDTGRPFIVHKKPETVWRVMEHIFLNEREVETRAFLLTGGTVTKQVVGKDNLSFYFQYIEPIKERIGNRWPCILQTSALEKPSLRQLRQAGVNIHESNIEVWDKRLFAWLCPGKESFVGREEWIKRVVESVDVFGEGNVSPGIVAGVEMAQPHGFKTVDEAVKSTAEGLDFLMSHGVTPRLANWCIEPTSELGGNPPIPLEYHIRVDIAWYETWKKYNLPPPAAFGPMGPGRAMAINSAFLDMGS